jgi:septin family protein
MGAFNTSCARFRAVLTVALSGCTGQTGLGKSTLINTLFASHLVDSKGRFAADEEVRQTTEIHPVSHGKSPFQLRLAVRAWTANGSQLLIGRFGFPQLSWKTV